MKLYLKQSFRRNKKLIGINIYYKSFYSMILYFQLLILFPPLKSSGIVLYNFLVFA